MEDSESALRTAQQLYDKRWRSAIDFVHRVDKRLRKKHDEQLGKVIAIRESALFVFEKFAGRPAAMFERDIIIKQLLEGAAPETAKGSPEKIADAIVDGALNLANLSASDLEMEKIQYPYPNTSRT